MKWLITVLLLMIIACQLTGNAERSGDVEVIWVDGHEYILTWSGGICPKVED